MVRLGCLTLFPYVTLRRKGIIFLFYYGKLMCVEVMLRLLLALNVYFAIGTS